MRRFRQTRSIAVVSCFAAAFALLASCGGDDGGSSDSGSGSGDGGSYDVTIAFANEALSFDPLLNQDQPGRIIYGNIYEPLIRRSTDGKTFEPLLASSLPTAIDDTTWEVALNPDATFASGKALAAEDVVYTLERVRDPNLESEQTTLYENITDVEAVDDATVRITTDAPDPIMLARLALLLIMPDGGADAPGFPETPESLDGTGPYRLVSHEADVETVIELRDDYWGDASGAPTRLVKRVVTEPATAISGLQTGEYDLVPRLDPDQAGQAPVLGSTVGTESVLLRTNTLAGPLQSAELRQAVNLAIDREAITSELWSGYASPSTCQIAAPSTFGHTDSLETPEFDPDRANEILTGAGAEGTTLSFTVPGDSFPKFREVAQVIQQNLEEAGFTVDLQFPESVDVLREQFTNKPSYPDLLLYSANSEFLDISQMTQWLESTGVFSAINEPQIDDWVTEGVSTVDPDERLDIYTQMNESICENVYNSYIYYPDELYGMSDAIEWQPRVDGLIIADEFRQA